MSTYGPCSLWTATFMGIDVGKKVNLMQNRMNAVLQERCMQQAVGISNQGQFNGPRIPEKLHETNSICVKLKELALRFFSFNWRKEKDSHSKPEEQCGEGSMCKQKKGMYG